MWRGGGTTDRGGASVGRGVAYTEGLVIRKKLYKGPHLHPNFLLVIILL